MKNKNTKWFVTITIFLLYFVYAIIRYNVFKGVPYSEIPLYVLNKAISWTAISLISISYLLSTLNSLNLKISNELLSERKFFGISGFFLAAIHVLISIIYLNPTFYSKFYSENGVLNTLTQLSLLFGIITFVILSIPLFNKLSPQHEKYSDKWRQFQNIGYWALFTAILHLGFMGFSGWFDISHWPGKMPPITLLSAIIAFMPLILRIYAVIKRKIT